MMQTDVAAAPRANAYGRLVHVVVQTAAGVAFTAGFLALMLLVSG
jgi:hypothetical protein